MAFDLQKMSDRELADRAIALQAKSRAARAKTCTMTHEEYEEQNAVDCELESRGYDMDFDEATGKLLIELHGLHKQSFADRGSLSGKTKGRCHRCHVVWWWKTGTRRLKDTRCPNCDGYLRPTTHLTKSCPWMELPAAGKTPLKTIGVTKIAPCKEFPRGFTLTQTEAPPKGTVRVYEIPPEGGN